MMNPEMLNTGSCHKNKNAVTPDHEVWVRNAVYTAIKMGIALSKQVTVGADDPLLSCGIRGVAVGAAIEIISTLGMRPDDGFVNLGDFEV